jgi:hypothetical protein
MKIGEGECDIANRRIAGYDGDDDRVLRADAGTAGKATQRGLCLAHRNIRQK